MIDPVDKFLLVFVCVGILFLLFSQGASVKEIPVNQTLSDAVLDLENNYSSCIEERAYCQDNTKFGELVKLDEKNQEL